MIFILAAVLDFAAALIHLAIIAGGPVCGQLTSRTKKPLPKGRQRLVVSGADGFVSAPDRLC